MLSRFYKLFETVHGYAIDFKNYLNELEEGRFIQNSIETLFLDMDGKQLLCESLFLYGIMLLALDVHIEGQVREKLLVAYFRYSGMYVSMKLQMQKKAKIWFLNLNIFFKKNLKIFLKKIFHYFENIYIPNYSGQQNSSESKFEDIVQLLRSTGFSPNQIKRTQKYPESFFKRILIPEHFVRMVVGRLRSDDIYNQVNDN